jgi:PAS domain S-box-containing protein
VAVLLLAPRRIWPLLIPAGLSGFVLYDLQADVPIPSIVRLILADIVEVLTAALCFSYFFNGVPRLDSVKALAKYSFVAVILAPFTVSLVGAFALPGNYWTRWKITFFSEGLALLTVTPAILGWFSYGTAFKKKSRAFYLEATALTSALVLLGYVIFVVSGKGVPPALLYSLVPILLWASLRFGLSGVSSSVIVIAFLSIWGAVHGRGPFTQPEPVNRVLLLQLFLLSTATPFMVLAVLLEEHKRAQEELREGEDRFLMAAQAGKMFAYEWDAATDAIVRSGGSARILGIDEAMPTSGQQILAKVHPDDQEGLIAAMAKLSPEKPYLQVSYRMVRPDGTVIWVERNSRAHFDEQGRIQRIVGMLGDITERKLAEQTLREYEKAVEGSEEMIAVVDREYRYLIANRKFLNCRGMTKEQVVGRLVPEVLNTGVFETVVKEKLDECFSGKVVKYEMRYTYPELGERDLFISNFPIEGSVGVDRVAFVLQDITERKRAEEAIRMSKEWLHLAIQAGRMYAFEWDMATDVIVRSGRCADVFNWMDDPWRDMNQQFSTRVHPNDREKYAATEAGLTPENPTYQTSYRLLRPDGSVIWLEESGHVSFDTQGKVQRIIGMVTDVTERKRTEEALRESEERLRMAAQAGRMYAYEWDVVSDTVVRSAECADVLGFGTPTHTTRRELLNCLHPDDHGMCGDLSVVTPQNPTLRARYRIGRPDGTWMWAEKAARAFFDEQGKMVRMIGMIADVTERAVMEEALSSVSRRLIAAQEQERFRIARELHDDVSQRMVLLQLGLQEFMDNMPELKPKAREHLQDISELASEVSSDLHNVSHQLHPARLDLIGLAATVGDYCNELSKQYHSQIEFVHHDVPAEIPKDVALCLFRIIQEALRNVVKHSGAAEAKVELSGHGHQIDLCISDQGEGFDAESAARQGGLGLISMRERLWLVGGHLSVESEPSHGTRIRVRVPLPATDAAVTTGEVGTKTEDILIKTPTLGQGS